MPLLRRSIEGRWQLSRDPLPEPPIDPDARIVTSGPAAAPAAPAAAPSTSSVAPAANVQAAPAAPAAPADSPTRVVRAGRRR
jgi:hypothetical protein